MSFDGTAARKGTLIGVMDGHGGWQAAEFARVTLPAVVTEEVRQCAGKSDDEHATKVRRCRLCVHVCACPVLPDSMCDVCVCVSLHNK